METLNPEISVLPGVNVLIEGPTGTGKTYSIGSLVETGVETFYLGLESGLEALLGVWADKGKPIPKNLHWHNLQLAVEGGFTAMADAAELCGRLTYDGLTKIQDPTRSKNNQYEKVLRVMANFVDQHTGESYGPVDAWGPNKAIVIDGLTGLGVFAMAMVVGKKPTSSQPDYLVAQTNLERFLRYTCDGCKCHFVLISHVEREIDMVMGGVKVTVSTLGKALPPKVPPMFSDVILCVRQGASWTWSTANNMVDLKTRSLPIAEGLPQDFSTIINKWKSRGGRFTDKVKT